LVENRDFVIPLLYNNPLVKRLRLLSRCFSHNRARRWHTCRWCKNCNKSSQLTNVTRAVRQTNGNAISIALRC